MDQRIAAPDAGEWGWHRPLTLMPMESALSFLGRLARAKAAPSTAAFCTDQGLRYDDLRRGEPEAMARLAAWGGIEPERLLHQTCRRISETEVAFLGFTFLESMLVLTQNRACPGCLRDDMVAGGPQAMHGRLFWMLRSFRTCPRHGLAIRTLPRSGEGRVHQDVIGDIRPLRAQILDGAFDTPVAVDPALERHLLDRLAGRPTTAWLDSLAPHVVARFSEVLGTALHLGRDTKTEDLDDDRLREASPHGFAALAGNPQALTAAFMTLRQRPGHAQDGPQARHGHLHRWFTGAQGCRPEYDSLRALYREHILDNWPIEPGVTLLGGLVEATRVHTVASASRHWKLPARQLRKILAARGLVSPAGDPGLDHVETFRTEQACDLLDTLAASISRPEVMQHLGLTQNQLRLLEEADLLPLLSLGPGIKPRHDGRAVVALMDRLEARVAGAVDLDTTGWKDLTTAARQAKMTLSGVVTAALVGHINVRRVSGPSGIAGLRFQITDGHVSPSTDPRPGRRAVSRRLHLSEAIIDLLVSAGHLRCESGFIPGTRLRNFSFDPGEVEAFDRAHISVAALAQAWNLPLKAVHDHLSERDVAPIFQNPSGRIRIYRREEANRARPADSEMVREN